MAFPSLEATLPCCNCTGSLTAANATCDKRIGGCFSLNSLVHSRTTLFSFELANLRRFLIRQGKGKWYRARPEKKALNHLPRHQGELNGREKCKYGGGAGEVVREGGVGLLMVFHLGLEGLEEEHPWMEVVLPVAASPPLPSQEKGRFPWHHRCHGFNDSYLFPRFGSMLDSIIESV